MLSPFAVHWMSPRSHRNLVVCISPNVAVWRCTLCTVKLAKSALCIVCIQVTRISVFIVIWGVVLDSRRNDVCSIIYFVRFRNSFFPSFLQLALYSMILAMLFVNPMGKGFPLSGSWKDPIYQFRSLLLHSSARSFVSNRGRHFYHRIDGSFSSVEYTTPCRPVPLFKLLLHSSLYLINLGTDVRIPQLCTRQSDLIAWRLTLSALRLQHI